MTVVVPQIDTEVDANIVEVTDMYATMKLVGYDGVEAWCRLPDFRLTSSGRRYALRLKRLETKQGHIRVRVLRTDEQTGWVDVKLVNRLEPGSF